MVAIGLGIFNILGKLNIYWYDYAYLLLGILGIGLFLYDLTNGYLTIENGTIRKNIHYGFGKKKMSIDEIIYIEKFAGDYTLKTEESKLKIKTDLIDKNSLTELNDFLDTLNLSPEKKPF